MYMSVRVIVINIIFVCPARDASEEIITLVAYYNEVLLLQRNQMHHLIRDK